MPEMDDKVGTSDKKVPEGGKKKGALNKYKWWIVGGLAVIAVLVFYFTSKSKSGSANQSTQAGIDPNTGLPIGGGGGPAGPRGPRGRRPPKRPVSHPIRWAPMPPHHHRRRRNRHPSGPEPTNQRAVITRQASITHAGAQVKAFSNAVHTYPGNMR